MSRFDQEWALVPAAARWIATLVGLVVAASIGGIFFVPFLIERDLKGFFIFGPFFLLAAFAGSVAAAYVLLVGYVYGDSRRRGMNHVLWTLLAIFIPNAIGIILYFILREPVPLPCPACRDAGPQGPRVLLELRRGGAGRVRAVPAADRGGMARLPALRHGARRGRGVADATDRGGRLGSGLESVHPAENAKNQDLTPSYFRAAIRAWQARHAAIDRARCSAFSPGTL